MPSPRETEYLAVLWGAEPLTIGEIAARINATAERPLAYTTVQTTLNRMTTKKLLTRVRDAEGVFRYAAATSAEAVRRGMVDQLAQLLFGGSVERLAAHLVEERLTHTERADIERMIAHSRRKAQP